MFVAVHVIYSFESSFLLKSLADQSSETSTHTQSLRSMQCVLIHMHSLLNNIADTIPIQRISYSKPEASIQMYASILVFSLLSKRCHSSSCNSSHISDNRYYNILTAEGTVWVLFQICWAAPDGNSLLLGKAEVSVEGIMISVWMAFKMQIETSLPTKWQHVSM